ncbi:receptor-like protein kinase [Neltuma alba]|uniref:receptor-like protein kinase n=1 Tax=Neltuma alba TaxID=207710 RepID=UPI0010A4D89E|nr:receptor-like protein kinase [Prosopis alba]
MKLQFLLLCLFAPLYVASALSSDGLTLLSLLNHWTSAPPSLKSNWNSSDSTHCSWNTMQPLQQRGLLNLSAYQIFGQLGPEIGRLTQLQNLLLARNGFSGTIPVELAHCSLLEHIDLSENHFSGNIPPEIGNCKSLKSLRLYSNQLGGAIPNELGRLSKLEDLELYFNHLTGEIPLTIWKIPNLEHVLLHNNSLSGKLPSEMTELKHLKNISLFDNQFSGPIPQSLGINSSLMKLDLMNNKFTGGIPPNLCFGKQLRTLSLGLNQLQGGIPQDLGRCATLRRLVLNENNLSGSIPEFEGDQNLIYMDISRNNISGEIPSSLGNCTNLTALILSTNNITGPIPSELGNLWPLQVLNLAHNNLEGPLPQQLSYCTKMDTFDVGFNFINGSFPSSMRSWKALTVLILRENRFSGVIPSFFSEYVQLLQLQLGGNMFGGKIPASMGSLQNLLYGLNLSANKLTGEIPLEIGKLKKLQILDISLNNLTGSIHVLGDLSSLTEVNISHNSFVGALPEWNIQHLNLLPSSFIGNPGLCVRCSTSNASTCKKPSFLKPCVSESTDHKGSKRSILFIVLGFVVFVICLSVSLLIYDHHYGQQSKEVVLGQGFEEYLPFGRRRIYYNDIARGLILGEGNADCEAQEAFDSDVKGEFRIVDLINATENLHDQYVIGVGGHGIVYKAELDFGIFAVKKVEFARSNRRKLNLIKEVEMTKKIRHQNVARCLGFLMGEEYGLTISRYRENGSLHDVLHESNPKPYLAWNVRYMIAIGIAKGLAHLHHSCDPPILHRDIKPKNILLDSDMQPYITDFGISLALNQSSTVVRMRSTYHIGTPGFMAPEIAYDVVPRCELDIYSYGVVLLELITRKKVLDSSFVEQQTTLAGWFKSTWTRTRTLEEIVDSSLTRELSDVHVKAQVIKTLLVALICVQKDPRKRLKMIDVVDFFETPTDPANFVQHDGASVHLGISLATAAASLFSEEKGGILPNSNNRHIVRRGTPGVLSKVELRTGEAVYVKKLLSAGYPSSITREEKMNRTVKHRNIIKLHRLWTEKDETFLMFEYLSNGSLHDVLHGKNPPPSLKWDVRYRIAIGIAQGLAYLHHDYDPPMVHFAIETKNILLDSDMEPRIAGFSAAQFLFEFDTTPSSSILDTSGTENLYATTITREFDVYSYGVVLLQLITRKKAIDSLYMGGTEIGVWVRNLWEETGDIQKIVDSRLAEEVLNSNSNVLEQVTQVLSLALRCTETDPCMRPTMRDVIKQLLGF